MNPRIFSGAVAIAFCLATATMAQDAVPMEILERTLLVKVQAGTATAFTIDYQGFYYFVTARHVAEGLPDKDAVLQVWRSGKWQDFKTTRTFRPAVASVDIAVFETSEKVAKPYIVSLPSDTEGITFGQQVWFLGYPFGDLSLTTSNKTEVLPFIKRGVISAINTSGEAPVFYIDGFNNPGFSGGPVVYWSFKTHSYRILGVVQGYRNETAKVVVNGVRVDSSILLNSGIIMSYGINEATKAIDAANK